MSAQDTADGPGPSADPEMINQLDPVFVHCRKEASLIFSIWVIALLWAVPYCYFNGYPDKFDPDSFETVMGIPSWVFWGIGAPWLVADVVTIFFCLFVMKEDDLEAASAAGSEVTV